MIRRKTTVSRILVIFSFLLLPLIGSGSLVFANTQMDNTAIKQYDTVAYFKVSKAVQGNESFTVKWHDMTWYFSTKENMELFMANPEKYAPQYDGYCAWAMSENRKAITDPEVWKIVGGKLYLNCSNAAYEKWSRDIPGNIQKADKNWSKYLAGD